MQMIYTASYTFLTDGQHLFNCPLAQTLFSIKLSNHFTFSISPVESTTGITSHFLQSTNIIIPIRLVLHGRAQMLHSFPHEKRGCCICSLMLTFLDTILDITILFFNIRHASRPYLFVFIPAHHTIADHCVIPIKALNKQAFCLIMLDVVLRNCNEFFLL